MSILGINCRIHLCGGSWYYDDPAWVRAANRFWFTPSDRVNGVGFRCARGYKKVKT